MTNATINVKHPSSGQTLRSYRVDFTDPPQVGDFVEIGASNYTVVARRWKENGAAPRVLVIDVE